MRFLYFFPLLAACNVVNDTDVATPQSSQPDWHATRADATEDGVRWDWAEVGDGSAWGWWSAPDKFMSDGHRAGQWVTFPPLDVAVQLVGDEQIEKCRAWFAKGATVCSVDGSGIRITLNSDGRVELRLLPSELRKGFTGQEVNASRSVDGRIEWFHVPGLGTRIATPDGTFVEDTGELPR